MTASRWLVLVAGGMRPAVGARLLASFTTRPVPGDVCVARPRPIRHHPFTRPDLVGRYREEIILSGRCRRLVSDV
jgi:hypothetical protein